MTMLMLITLIATINQKHNNFFLFSIEEVPIGVIKSSPIIPKTPACTNLSTWISPNQLVEGNSLPGANNNTATIKNQAKPGINLIKVLRFIENGLFFNYPKKLA